MKKKTYKQLCGDQRDVMFMAAHPGVFLAMYVEGKGMTARSLARKLGVAATTVTNVLRERNGITADLALGLAECFDQPARWWLRLQLEYDLDRAFIARARRQATTIGKGAAKSARKPK